MLAGFGRGSFFGGAEASGKRLDIGGGAREAMLHVIAGQTTGFDAQGIDDHTQE